MIALPLERAATQGSALVSSELQTALEREPSVQVIVNLRAEPAVYTSREARAQGIARRAAALQSSLGAELQDARSFRHTAAVSGTLTRAGALRLAGHPDVAFVQLDHRGRAQLTEAVAAVQAANVHSALQLTGKGVRVAVLDTGVEPEHPDLRDAVVAQRCFTRGNCAPLQRNEGSDATDDNGHGTSVAGAIASRGRVSGPGFAPAAELVIVKVLAADSTGQESDWVAGLDWIYDNLDRLQVRLVNLSFVSELLFDDGTCDRAAPALAGAIENLTRAGVTVLGASGNNGSREQLAVPACNTGVIAVGASYDGDVGPMPGSSGTFLELVGSPFADCRDDTTSTTRLTCYTNSSPRLDLIAPGSPIVSDWIGGGTSLRGGTSYAAAAVTGIAALLLECNPELDPSALLGALKETGLPLADARNGLTFPLVQAENAARRACPGLPAPDAGTVRDAGVAAMPDAGVPDAGVDSGPALQPRAAGSPAAAAGAPATASQAMGVMTAMVDAALPAEADQVAAVDFDVPRRMPKARVARGGGPSGICASVAPGQLGGSSLHVLWVSLVACCWWRRRRRGASAVACS